MNRLYDHIHVIANDLSPTELQTVHDCANDQILKDLRETSII
jgi:hypothetical protein